MEQRSPPALRLWCKGVLLTLAHSVGCSRGCFTGVLVGAFAWEKSNQFDSHLRTIWLKQTLQERLVNLTNSTVTLERFGQKQTFQRKDL